MKRLIENFLASIVSNVLSVAGVATRIEQSYIFVPSLNHTFLVTLPCSSWIVIALQAFLYMFLMWVYIETSNRTFPTRNYVVLGVIGFGAFFLTNILRIVIEIYLVGTVYNAVYTHYLLNWSAFEEQIGMGLMFTTLSILCLTTYLFVKRDMKGAILSTVPRLLKGQDLSLPSFSQPLTREPPLVAR